MARIEQYLAARVSANTLMEHFKGHAVVQVFTGVDFITQVHPLFIAGVEHRQPAFGQLIERGFDKPRRALRERE
ncbi:hypothetical protein D3C78_1677420 [compost metagenome]